LFIAEITLHKLEVDMMSGEFTYEKPNEEGIMRALLAQLKVEGFKDVAEVLEGSECEITHEQQFSYKRWNAFKTEVVIRVPAGKYELAVEKVTDEAKDKIVAIVDNLTPKEAGLDVMSMKLSPSIKVTPQEESLTPALDRSTEILSEEVIEQILPKDIKGKGKEMAHAYIYLYCVENALRLFIEKIAKENYGESYFSNLKKNPEIERKLVDRKRDEKKNQWLRIRGNSETFYLDFDDLESIIRNNWEIFEGYFPSQGWIVTKIDDLSKCRNLVAHNSYIDKEERELIRVYFNNILKQIGSRMGKKG
jgi:hypothetical protein